MRKILLVMLPLAWLVVLAPHVRTAREHTGTEGRRRWICPPFGAFYRSDRLDASVTVDLNGHTLKSVTVDPGANVESCTRHIAYRVASQSSQVRNATVVLSSSSMAKLANGPQQLRFTLDDGTFADCYVEVAETRGPPRGHNNR